MIILPRAAFAALAMCVLSPLSQEKVESHTINPQATQQTSRLMPALIVQPAIHKQLEPAVYVPPARPRSLSSLVERHTSDQPQGRIEDCLARAVYFESRGEPLEGQLAVAEVIINRVASGRFSDHVCDVIRQPHQFSFVRDGVIPQPKRETRAWRRSVAIARIALRDLWNSRASKALYFHATYVTPGWSRRLDRQARLGDHIFYR